MLRAAQDDLEAIAGGLVHDRFYAIYEQVESDQVLLDALLKNFYGEGGDDEQYTHLFGVKHIRFLQDGDPARDISRFRIWSLERSGFQFRIFYGYFERERLIIILGVAARDSRTYEPNHPFIQRISGDFDRLYQKYG